MISVYIECDICGDVVKGHAAVAATPRGVVTMVFPSDKSPKPWTALTGPNDTPRYICSETCLQVEANVIGRDLDVLTPHGVVIYKPTKKEDMN